MRNQFFYTFEYTVAPATQVTPEPVVIKRMASFNIEKVIRTLETEDDKLIVILDDFHEETRQSVKNNSNGKPIVGTEKVMLQSEIHLNPEDKDRFRAATNIWDPVPKKNINEIPVVESGI